MQLNVCEIREILPHRFPMLLVDAVRSLEPGASIVGVKAISSNERCYARLQCPQEAPYPYSLIMESFVQAASILWLKSQGAVAYHENRLLLFGAIKNCTFVEDVFPGDILEHHVSIDQVLADCAIFRGESQVDGRTIFQASWVMTVTRPSIPM